jgi:hypothetical protein
VENLGAGRRACGRKRERERKKNLPDGASSGENRTANCGALREKQESNGGRRGKSSPDLI